MTAYVSIPLTHSVAPNPSALSSPSLSAPNQAASETLRGSVISYKRGEKPSCGQHLAAARWPAVFSSMSMGFDANPRSSADAGENQIHLDEVHDLLIALVSKFLNLNQGSGSFGMHCIL